MLHSRKAIATTLRVAALAAVLSAAVPGAAAADEDALRRTPVGTWDGAVTVGEDPPHHATFSFTTTGRACLNFGSPGGPSGTGSGGWFRTGPNRFSYHLTHTVYDPQGTLIGTVVIDHQASQTGDRFTSSGTSKVFAPDGTPVRTGPSAVDATRTSSGNPTCK